ncbi:MAG: restriction endonuclease subunit S, partial [Dialister sp.]|nr:restriction endonuclease subunit S [Dialister sp.]
MALTEELRMSILQFALQGKITEQFIADSSVDKLFETIQEKKNAMISAGVIKKEKKLPPLDDDVLFDIPQSWRWARMQYFLDVRDGTHDSPKYYAQGVPFVTSKNISNGYLDFTDVNYISQADADKINQRSLVEDNDILLAMIGSIGNPVKVHKDREFAIKNMALIKAVPQSNINMDYVLILLRYMQAIMKRDSSGGVQKFVSLSYLREFPVPIPPIEEQQRIVDRVNVLMSKLDEFSEIEQQLIALKANFPADMRGAILQAAMQGKLTEQLESDTPVDILLDEIKPTITVSTGHGRKKSKQLDIE